MTVVKFANWPNVISSDMTEAKGGFSVTEDRALNMRIRDFMARCPATVREAQEQLKARRAAAAKPAAAKASLAKKAARIQREE